MDMNKELRESTRRQIVELVKQYDFTLVPAVERLLLDSDMRKYKRIPPVEVALCNLNIPQGSPPK